MREMYKSTYFWRCSEGKQDFSRGALCTVQFFAPPTTPRAGVGIGYPRAKIFDQIPYPRATIFPQIPHPWANIYQQQRILLKNGIFR